MDEHAIADADAARSEPVRHPSGGVGELGVAPDTAITLEGLPDEEGMVTPGRSLCLDEVGYVDTGEGMHARVTKVQAHAPNVASGCRSAVTWCGTLPSMTDAMTFAVAATEALAESSDPDLARSLLGAAEGHGFDADRRRILDLIDDHDDIAVRTCRPGHLTGSAFVVDPSRGAALVLFHTKLQRWLQPGGHADGDMNLANVAWREATEETGIDGLRVVTPAIDVDIHRVDPPA